MTSGTGSCYVTASFPAKTTTPTYDATLENRHRHCHQGQPANADGYGAPPPGIGGRQLDDYRRLSGGGGTGAVTFAVTGNCSVSGTQVTMTASTGQCSITVTKAADKTTTVQHLPPSWLLQQAAPDSGGDLLEPYL